MPDEPPLDPNTVVHYFSAGFHEEDLAEHRRAKEDAAAGKTIIWRKRPPPVPLVPAPRPPS